VEEYQTDDGYDDDPARSQRLEEITLALADHPGALARSRWDGLLRMHACAVPNSMQGL
jgi:hypothetical protein